MIVGINELNDYGCFLWHVCDSPREWRTRGYRQRSCGCYHLCGRVRSPRAVVQSRLWRRGCGSTVLRWSCTSAGSWNGRLVWDGSSWFGSNELRWVLWMRGRRTCPVRSNRVWRCQLVVLRPRKSGFRCRRAKIILILTYRVLRLRITAIDLDCQCATYTL